MDKIKQYECKKCGSSEFGIEEIYWHETYIFEVYCRNCCEGQGRMEEWHE